MTAENFTAPDVDAWVAELDRFYRDELAVFGRGGDPARLIAYQAPIPGSHLNQASVVYARPTDEHGNPELPAPAVIAKLRGSGIERVVVGHTPSGDCPALVRDDGFELVLGDNSYGRLEYGSQLAFTDAVTSVRGITELDDGSHVIVAHDSPRDAASPVGRRDRDTGQLVKAALADGSYLLFRGARAAPRRAARDRRRRAGRARPGRGAYRERFETADCCTIAGCAGFWRRRASW